MKENKKLEILIIVISVIMLLPLFHIAMYNRPSVDDYDYAIYTHQAIENGGGLLQVIKAAWDTNVEFYNEWQGLYVSAFLMALEPGILGEKYYALTTYILMGLMYILLLFTINILNKYFIKRSKLFVATSSLAVLTSLVLWLPDITQGLFWYCGAINYMPFVFLMFLSLAILIEIYYKHGLKKNVMVVVSCMVSFILSGGNHVTAFGNILLLLVATVLLVYKKRYYSFPTLVSAIVGFIIMFTAPGTAVRQDAFVSPGVINTIFSTLDYVRYLLGTWLSIYWIISIVLLTPMAVEIATKNEDKFSERFPIIPLLVSAMLLCGMLCVPYYAMGSYGDGRLINVIWITFMLLSWVNYVLIIGFFVKNGYINKTSEYKKSIIWAIVLVVTFSSLFFIINYGKSSNSVVAIKELKYGVAEQHAIDMDYRFELFNDDTLEEVAVPSLCVNSEILFFADFGKDPNAWPNTSIGEYYNKRIWRY